MTIEEEPFDTDLTNPGSTLYQLMSNNIKEALNELFCIQISPICAVEITGFHSAQRCKMPLFSPGNFISWNYIENIFKSF